MDWLPASRRDEAAIKSQRSKQKRRQKQIDLDRLEAARHIDHTDTLDKLETWDAEGGDVIEQEPENTLHINLTENTEDLL